jgi:hypothetical protein
MDETGLLAPRRLLTGYIPNAAALEVIRNLAQKLKSDNPHLIYLLDRKFPEISSPSIFLIYLFWIQPCSATRESSTCHKM